MNVGIGLKESSYTPEAYAYSKFLSDRGFKVQLEHEYKLDLDNDVNIYFMGFSPFWKVHRGKALEVHEYASLSTGSFPLAKNAIKKKLSKKPSGRIFLNETVNKGFGFQDDVPYIFRDMGVDEALFQEPNAKPEFDIVYAGSINGRVGLIEIIFMLVKKNFKLLIIGDVSKDILIQFQQYPNIKFTGRVKREEIPSLFQNCKAGLNYTPDFYPFNIQTSTKTLEYLASGLRLISNRYNWIEKFSLQYNISPLWLDDIEEGMELQPISKAIFLKEVFSWSAILKNSNFDKFISKELFR